MKFKMKNCRRYHKFERFWDILLEDSRVVYFKTLKCFSFWSNWWKRYNRNLKINLEQIYYNFFYYNTCYIVHQQFENLSIYLFKRFRWMYNFWLTLDQETLKSEVSMFPLVWCWDFYRSVFHLICWLSCVEKNYEGNTFFSRKYEWSVLTRARSF